MRSRSVLVVLAATAFSASVLADSISITGGKPTERTSAPAASEAPAGGAAQAPVAGAGARIAIPGAADNAPLGGREVGLRPRKAIAKQPSSSIRLPYNAITQQPEVTGRVLVKFKDDVKARAPRTPSVVIEDGNRATMTSAVSALVRGGGGVAWQAIDRSPEELRVLQAKAESMSGEAAIDLAGFIYVTPSDGDLVSCAKAFNDLDEVEFVVVEQLPFPAFMPQEQSGAQPACGIAPRSGCQNPPGAVNCNKPGIIRSPPAPAPPPTGRCTNVITGSSCSDNCETPCDTGVNDPNCMMGCNHTECCQQVNGFLPACITAGHGWDGLCAAYANSICTTTTYDALFPQPGNDQSVPGSFKYDPCYALRAGPNPANPDFTIQASLASALPTQPLPPTVNFPHELVQVTAFDAGGITAGLVTGVAPTNTNAAFLSAGQLAYQDPSFERVPYEMTPTCFTSHPGRRGCNNTPCCVYVCTVDPACCTIAWDNNCVQVASRLVTNNPCVQPLAGSIPASTNPGPADFPMISMANFPAGGSTPSFVGTVNQTPFGPQARNLQVWNTAAPVAAQLENIEFDPAVSVNAVARPTSQGALNATRMFLNSGFRGGGLDLTGFEQAAGSFGVPLEAARAQGVTIGIIDNSAFVAHEDFASVLSVEPNVPIETSSVGSVDPHHGTAVIGILLAQDNGFGITGAAQNAKGIFYPSFGGNGIGGRFFNAFASAVTSLNPGDVICIPLDFPVLQVDPLTGALTVLDGTVLQSPEVFALAVLAGQLGITTVVAAGNQCSPVATVPPGSTDSSPAIVVGAVWPGAPRFPGLFQGIHYCRSDFSNFSSTDSDSEVDVAGWGAYVATCGYGDLWRGNNGAGDSNQVNQLRTYTLQFGGTSAACAMVAACAARLQATAEQLFGTPISPGQIKTAIRANIKPQCGFPEGSPQQLTGSVPCMGDTGGGGEVNSIRGFINMGPVMASTIATQPFGSLPENVTGFEVTVLVGTLLAGNAYTVRSDDSEWMKIQAKRVGGSALGPMGGPPLFYPPTALITDVMVTVTTDFTSPQELYGIACTAIGQALPGTYVFSTGYIYNNTIQRWLLLPDMLQFFADTEEPLPDGDVAIASGEVDNLYNVVNLIDFSSGMGKIRFRIVTSAPPLANSYQTWWDFLQIQPNPPLQPCWVAQAVYGESNPRWMLFRTWLDRHAPAAVRDAYLRLGQPVAAIVRHSPKARAMLRPLFDAAISTLDRQEIDASLARFGKTAAGRAMFEKAEAIRRQAASQDLGN